MLPAGVVRLGTLDGSRAPTDLIKSDSKAVYASGHLLFVRSGNLMAQAFDASRFETRGEPLPLTRVRANSTNGRAVFTVSDARVLVYRANQEARNDVTIAERDGSQVHAISSDGGRSTIMTARSLDSGVSGRAFDEPQPAYSHERAIYDVPFPSSTGASGYGVVPGGKRFVVLDASQQIEPLTAVTNWPSMLKP